MKHPEKPTVAEVNSLCRAYYDKPGNGAGGRIMHVVLDDGNMKLRDISYASEQAVAAGDSDAVRICDLLQKMSATQRRKVGP